MFQHMSSISFATSAAGAATLHIAWVAHMWTPTPLPHLTLHEHQPLPMMVRTISLQSESPTPLPAQQNPDTTANIRQPEALSPPLQTEPTNEPTPRLTTSLPQTDVQTDSHYWPGKALDQKPTPQNPVVISYPEGFISITHGHAILQLFINESGLVDRVEIVESEAPLEFTDMARRAFLNTRFSPGVKDQIQVRSKLKIEVSFQNGPNPEGN